MDKAKLESLKTELNSLKLKNNELSRAKGKEKQTIEAEIQHFTNKIISEFDLMQYDLHIKEESHKTKFFIFDVENIIRRQEEDSNNQ